MKEQKGKSESDGKIVTPEEVKEVGMKTEVGTKEVADCPAVSFRFVYLHK